MHEPQPPRTATAQPRTWLFNPWLRLSIKYKLGLTIALMIVALGTLLISMQTRSNFVMESAYAQENDYYHINAFQNELITADTAISTFLRSITARDNYKADFDTAFTNMSARLASMNTDLNEISLDQYLLTMALRKGFVSYTEQCTRLFSSAQYGAATASLYQYYGDIDVTQGYLLETARALQSEALTEGQANLSDLRADNDAQNNLYTILSLFAVLVLITLTSELVQIIVVPVLNLSAASTAIRNGNFDTPDVYVDSEDELRVLAIAFNDMKHNMKRMFETMQEKTAMEAQLYQKELESRENSRLLAQAQMQQLRNQINPHFLFNTLNIISRTARREKAKKSEKLILSLARLFRYSLKTDDEEVTLLREINIVNDYISIQTTRFEQRVRLVWNLSENLEPAGVLVPAFLFQPLIENAVIHGLEPKREGGVIRIRAHIHAGILQIFVTDNGVGMSKETIAKNLNEQRRKGDVSGIGVGNVRTRLRLLHPDASFRLRSKEGRGTSIWISIPLNFKNAAAHFMPESMRDFYLEPAHGSLILGAHKISKEQYETLIGAPTTQTPPLATHHAQEGNADET